MARWVIERSARRGNGAVRVFYENLITKRRYDLGALSSDVPDSLIVDWVLAYGGPAEGDIVVLGDGDELSCRGGRLSVREVKLENGNVVSVVRSVYA